MSCPALLKRAAIPLVNGKRTDCACDLLGQSLAAFLVTVPFSGRVRLTAERAVLGNATTLRLLADQIFPHTAHARNVLGPLLCCEVLKEQLSV